MNVSVIYSLTNKFQMLLTVNNSPVSVLLCVYWFTRYTGCNMYLIL